MSKPSLKIVVELCPNESGNWYWAVKIDGEIYADGMSTDRRMALYWAVIYSDQCAAESTYAERP